MHVGLTMFPTDYSIPPHDLAVAAEARGYELLWLPEHSHIPTSRKSPWPGGAWMSMGAGPRPARD